MKIDIKNHPASIIEPFDFTWFRRFYSSTIGNPKLGFFLDSYGDIVSLSDPILHSQFFPACLFSTLLILIVKVSCVLETQSLTALVLMPQLETSSRPTSSTWVMKMCQKKMLSSALTYMKVSFSCSSPLFWKSFEFLQCLEISLAHFWRRKK